MTTIAAVTISDGDVNGKLLLNYTCYTNFLLKLLNLLFFSEPTVLVSGNDFYAFPRIDPIKRRMAWIEWSNPNMSWDKAQLWVGYFSEKG